MDGPDGGGGGDGEMRMDWREEPMGLVVVGRVGGYEQGEGWWNPSCLSSFWHEHLGRRRCQNKDGESGGGTDLKIDGRIQGLGFRHVKIEMFPKATSWEQMDIQMYSKKFIW